MIDARLHGRVGALTLDATLSLARTGVTALVGRSGAGKSTVLRYLAGLVRIAGTITVAEEVWQDERRFVPAHRRAVGMVFQETALLPHLDVRENLRFGLQRATGPHRFAFDDVVARLGLATLLDRRVERLSGGEGKRVAIGRALLRQPVLLLMDEPLAALDAHAKREVGGYLRDLFRAIELPVLYVSHDRGEVAALADRLLRLDQGSIQPLPLGDPTLAGLERAKIEGLARAALQAGLPPAA